MALIDDLYAESTCFLCYGVSQAQALKLALLARQALAGNPAADVTPQGLLSSASCFNCYAEGSLFDLFELALLSIIAASGGGPGTCENLEGASSPLNVVTPDFIGQVFVQSDGTIWQAVSLLSSSWAVICDGANDEGLVWGPTPETVDSIDGANDAFLTDLDTRFNTGGGAYTTLSFGNPVTVTNGVDFSGSTSMTSLEFRLLQTVGADFNIPGSGASVTESLLMDSIVSIGGFFDLSDNPALTTIALESLQNVGSALIGNSNPLLTSLLLSSIVTIGEDIDFNDCATLVIFSAEQWLPTDSFNVNFSLCSLNAISVNHILARCIANPAFVSGTVDLSGGTNAAPTGQGIIDAADLVTRGVTVNTN